MARVVPARTDHCGQAGNLRAGHGSSVKPVLVGGVIFLSALIDSCNPGDFPNIEGLPANFHVVDNGRVYRSAQPDPGQLQTIVEHFGIRTVLNLRGENTGKGWYDAEARACEAAGVTLVNHSMSARSLPPPEMMAAILETLAGAEYPMLIHCESGADRTSAIAAIYRMAVLGDDRAAALQELSLSYLHVRALRPCMDTLAESFDTQPDWLDRYAVTTSQSCQ
jgi:protein tyrosine/serine phosphatase